MGRSRKIGPDGVHGLPLLQRESIQSLGDMCQHYAHVGDLAITHLLELEIRSLVGHTFVPWAEFTVWGSQCPVHILWRIHPEVVGSQRLFALESHGGMSRIMTRGGMSEFCLGEGVAGVGVLGRHGIWREDACEQGVFNAVVNRTGTSAMCSDLNRMHDGFREMSPPWDT